MNNNVLIILLIGLFRKKHYEKLIDNHHWQTVKYVRFYTRLTASLTQYDFGAERPKNLYERTAELYLTYYQLVKRTRIDRLANSLNLVDNLVLGSYRSDYDLHFRHFANRVNCNNIYVIDVGTNTLDFARHTDEIGESKVITGSDKGNIIKRLKRVIRNKFINWDTVGLKKVTFFTCYDVDGIEANRIIKNEYKYIKSLMSNCPVSNSVLFLGESLVDDGLLSLEVYLDYLSRIRTYFADNSVLYIPHPRESEKYVQAIRKKLNFETKRFDVPIEYALTTAGTKPKCIASFFSSALPNCSVIFGENISIKSFHLQAEHLLKGNDMVDRIYSHFASKMSGNIEVIFDY
jgi:hypothetical protein